MTEQPAAAQRRPPSIWLRAERSARGPAPEHSRGEIARAGVALADDGGLAAVTMRSVAAAVGTAPASLYRYVSTRDDILELMQDEVAGEYSFTEAEPGEPGEPEPGEPVARLLRLAHQARAIYLRHPWLLDLPAAVSLPGPNGVAYLEHVLAALDRTGLSGPAQLETIGVYTGIVRLLARTEVDQRNAGQAMAEWQGAVGGYLLGIAADGHHPHLAAVLADQAADPPAEQESLFDRTLTRILAGLLPSG